MVWLAPVVYLTSHAIRIPEQMSWMWRVGFSHPVGDAFLWKRFCLAVSPDLWIPSWGYIGTLPSQGFPRLFAWDRTLTQIAILWVVIFSERPEGTRRNVCFYFPSLAEGCPAFALFLSWKGKLMRPSVLWVLPFYIQDANNSPGPLLAGHQ